MIKVITHVDDPDFTDRPHHFVKAARAMHMAVKLFGEPSSPKIFKVTDNGWLSVPEPSELAGVSKDSPSIEEYECTIDEDSNIAHLNNILHKHEMKEVTTCRNMEGVHLTLHPTTNPSAPSDRITLSQNFDLFLDSVRTDPSRVKLPRMSHSG